MLGDKMANIIFVFPFLFLGIHFFKLIDYAKFSLLAVVLGIISIILAMILWFFMPSIVGTVSFWIENIFFHAYSKRNHFPIFVRYTYTFEFLSKIFAISDNFFTI
jgi:ABC-2 type transport system permease protein